MASSAPLITAVTNFSYATARLMRYFQNPLTVQYIILIRAKSKRTFNGDPTLSFNFLRGGFQDYSLFPPYHPSLLPIPAFPLHDFDLPSEMLSFCPTQRRTYQNQDVFPHFVYLFLLEIPYISDI